MNPFATPRRLARISYERLLAPFGLRALSRMLDDGLPSRLELPLRFLFDRRAPASARNAATQIERLRSNIAARGQNYRFEYSESSLGTVRLAEPTPQASATLTSRDLAIALSVPKRWGIFLHLCSEAVDAGVILEMGACVGISGAYLASTPGHPSLFTLEGSRSLADVAKGTLAAARANAEVIVGSFEKTLPHALKQFSDKGQKLDVAFVDGHHDEAATLHYANTIAPHLSSNGVMILDDIYLYEEMWRAWQQLASSSDFVAINTGRFGLLVRGNEEGDRQFDLSPYTGRWRVGISRGRSVAASRNRG